MSIWPRWREGWIEGTRPRFGSIVQGKPVARRGRKARDLRRKTARLPIAGPVAQTQRSRTVKANLARFTGALALLASLAHTIGAGIRWY
jgi:hypothetical protein